MKIGLKENNCKKVHPLTAVWRDWGFSGISVFLLPLRSAENTRFQKSPTTPSAKTLAVSLPQKPKNQQTKSEYIIMKKIISLIIIITFSSCRYFNVSPVNGITTKNLTEKPLPKDFIGMWKIDKYSYDLIKEKNYEKKIVELNIKNDGNFEAKNFPDFIDVFSENNTEEYINAKGNWKIEKDFDGEKWILLLIFEKNELYTDGLTTEFELYIQEDKLILWHFVGDPDSGERLLFQKE